jgi:hypothetical protein
MLGNAVIRINIESVDDIDAVAVPVIECVVYDY